MVLRDAAWVGRGERFLGARRCEQVARVDPGLRNQGRLSSYRRAEDKFRAVVETAGLAETVLAAYRRRKEPLPAQIARWREACVSADASSGI